MSPLTFRRTLKGRADRVRAVVGLVSTDHVDFGYRPASDASGYIELKGTRPIRASAMAISLSLGEGWQISGNDVLLAASRYTIADSRTGREIVAYHYHPPSPPETHLHLGAGAGQLIDAVHRAHFPARGATLEDLIAMLIRDFRVRPTRHDWERILREG